MPRLEIDHNGNIVNTLPSAMVSNLNAMVNDLFSQNSWTYVENSKTGSYRDVTITSPDGDVYNIDLFTANIRNESRNDAEKKIQLGSVDPRTYTTRITLILGFYVCASADPLHEAIIVAYPVKGSINYPTNPSIRSTFVDGILVKAKRNGFEWDKANHMVAFRPEFVFYYLKNYDTFHSYPTKNVALKCNTGCTLPDPRNLIVFGAPGTGKTHYIEQKREKILSGGGIYERVTFHPDYTYSQFVGTYKPVTDSSGDIVYKFVPGPFTRVLTEAYKNSMTGIPLPHILIIEEINRAKVSAVFGDVFQLLDRKSDVSEYPISTSEDIKLYLADQLGGVPDDYKELRIPDNMFIWATMNSADQGVFPMDTAFKRRWNFMYIGIDDDEISVDDTTGNKIENTKLKFELNGVTIRWNVLRRAINRKLSSSEINAHEDKLLGPFFIKCDQFTLDASDKLSAGDNELFLQIFTEKVLMYLFEDVGKTRRPELFSGISKKCSRYSEVKSEFLEHGMEIFGSDFKTEFYDKEEIDYDGKKRDEGV